MRKGGGVFILVLFVPSLLLVTYLWKLNSYACICCSLVPGHSVFPDSVVAQCATDFSLYSDSQLSLIKKKKKRFCLLWLPRQPQKYEPNVKWCLHESAVTLHSEQKPASLSRKRGEQIMRVLLPSLAWALSPTATSCLFFLGTSS